jgi:hypothetical protein
VYGCTRVVTLSNDELIHGRQLWTARLSFTAAYRLPCFEQWWKALLGIKLAGAVV